MPALLTDLRRHSVSGYDGIFDCVAFSWFPILKGTTLDIVVIRKLKLGAIFVIMARSTSSGSCILTLLCSKSATASQRSSFVEETEKVREIGSGLRFALIHCVAIMPRGPSRQSTPFDRICERLDDS
jgi:hypothetical protein